MAGASQQQFLNVKAFDGIGYSNWEYRVKLILEQQSILHVLSMNPPITVDELEKFRKSDGKARTIIVQCLADNVLEMVKEKTTAKEMLETLKLTYQKTGIATQIQLLRKLRTLNYKGKSPLNEYLVEYEKTVVELRNAGGKIEKSEMITQLLSGMPESYQPVVTAIDVLFCQNENDVTFDFVKNKLIMEEERQKKNNAGETLSGQSENVFMGYKSRIKKFNHGNKQMQTNSGERQSYIFKGKCFVCGNRGHKRYQCPQRTRTQVNVTEGGKEKEDISFISEVRANASDISTPSKNDTANLVLSTNKDNPGEVTFFSLM